MQTDIPPNIPPLEPVTRASVASTTNWSRNILFILMGLIIVAGLVSAGIQIGKQQNVNQSTIQPTNIPAPVTTGSTMLPDQQSPTTGPYINWKTYTSASGKYKISYPPRWYVYEYGGPSFAIDISDIPNPTNMHNLDPRGHTLIQIGRSSNSMPTNILYTNGPDKLNPTVKQFTINSYTGIRGQRGTIFNVVGETVYLNDPHGGYYFFDKDLDPEHLFDQILSTFRYLDQPTADWKTHKNEKFMYEFKRPQTWKVEIASETGTPNYGNWISDEQTPPNGFLFEIGTSGSKSNESACITLLDTQNEFTKTYVQVNDINWIKYESPTNIYAKAYNPKLNYCVRFSINPLAENKRLDVFDQILSTIKFLE